MPFKAKGTANKDPLNRSEFNVSYKSVPMDHGPLAMGKIYRANRRAMPVAQSSCPIIQAAHK